MARSPDDRLPSLLFRLLGGSTVVSSLVNLVEISGFEPEQTEPKSVVLPLHHISLLAAGAARACPERAVGPNTFVKNAKVYNFFDSRWFLKNLAGALMTKG